MSEHLLVNEKFREYLSEFKFSTAAPTLQRSSSTAQSVNRGVLPSISTSRKGKRKVSDGSPSKSPAKKLNRGYAPPEKYAHLLPLTDYLAYGLDVVFCGINPGCMSAQKGHHFANPTNHFWKCLHQSGYTSRLLPPSEDHSLPASFNIGLTNLVNRPSAEASELSSSERDSSVPILLSKLALHRPKFLCLVGTSNWDVIRKAFLQMLNGSSKASGSTKANNIGLQPFKICYPPVAGLTSDSSADTSKTLLFVVPSTSGRVVQYQLPDKVKLFSDLKKLVDKPSSEIDTSKMKCITIPPPSTNSNNVAQDV